jgi:NAD(P)H-hydrate epimerase
LKLCHITTHARRQSGDVAVVDIGIPTHIQEMVPPNHFLINEDMVFGYIGPKDPLSNKGDYGKLLNIAGSDSMPGAAALSTKGALRSGAGIVTLASTKTVVNNLSSTIFESKFISLYENEKGYISIFSMPQILDALEKSDCCLIGCGLGLTEDTTFLVENILKQAKCPIVIDADGINALAKNIDILKKKNTDVILTPHVGEMARLLNVPISEVVDSRYRLTAMFAKQYDVTVVLKDYNTIIVDPAGNVYVNLYGNPGLAKGGSGDLLSGIIAGLVSQKISKAAVCGVFIHSVAADMCAARKSKYAMLSSDILDDVCEIFLRNDR